MKKGFIIGLTAGLTIAGASLVFANSQIQAILNEQIKVTLNGQVQEFIDETTNEVQYPITYKNRTYLPLRTVANLVGVDVDYDSSNNTAILNTNEIGLSDIFSKLDFSNSLEGYVFYDKELPFYNISYDGTTLHYDIYGDEGDVKTNLSESIKSFKVLSYDSVDTPGFIVLTNSGKLYKSKGLFSDENFRFELIASEIEEIAVVLDATPLPVVQTFYYCVGKTNNGYVIYEL